MNELRNTRKPPLLVVVSAILWAECAVLSSLIVTLVVDLLRAEADSFSSAIALLVLAILAAGWLGAMAVGAARARPWIRGGAIVWQLLQCAVAVTTFQGVFASPLVGWALLVPAVFVLGLLFTPSVIAATKREQG